MAHDQALLNDILAHPDDDGPRLVYADWLEEHREADRARLIRLQCELAPLPVYHPRLQGLAAEEDKLLQRHGAKWAAPISDWVSSWGFRRGFVEELRITLQQWRAHLANVLALAPIRRVHLQRLSTLPGPATARELAESPLLGRLAELDLKNATFQHLELTALAASPHLAGLRELGLHNNPVAAAGLEALGAARFLGGLERLDLSMYPLMEGGAAPLDPRLIKALAGRPGSTG